MNDSIDKISSVNPRLELEGMPPVSPGIDQISTRQKTLECFSAAWSKGDVDTLLGLMSEEPVYKGSTGEKPGTVFIGREKVRVAFERMAGPNANSTGETAPTTPPEMYFFADRALVFWRLSLPDADGLLQEVDGVDVITFTDDGRIAVKDAYRKAFA